MCGLFARWRGSRLSASPTAPERKACQPSARPGRDQTVFERTWHTSDNQGQIWPWFLGESPYTLQVVPSSLGSGESVTATTSGGVPGGADAHCIANCSTKHTSHTYQRDTGLSHLRERETIVADTAHPDSPVRTRFKEVYTMRIASCSTQPAPLVVLAVGSFSRPSCPREIDRNAGHDFQTERRNSSPASERRWGNNQGFKDLCLKAKARIWP